MSSDSSQNVLHRAKCSHLASFSANLNVASNIDALAGQNFVARASYHCGGPGAFHVCQATEAVQWRRGPLVLSSRSRSSDSMFALCAALG